MLRVLVPEVLMVLAVQVLMVLVPNVRHDEGAGVLILSDMFGGTASNLAMSFLSQGNVEVITGVNLPMLIKLARPPADADLLTIAREMREHGRNAIWVASDLLRGQKP